MMYRALAPAVAASCASRGQERRRRGSCAEIARAPWILAWSLLVVLFIPVHVWLWDEFPLWYHATFLVSLLPLTAAGRVAVRPAIDAEIGYRSSAGTAPRRIAGATGG